MAKRKTIGVGMMQRTLVEYSLINPADAEGLQEALRSFGEQLPIAKPDDWMDDALHRDNAERCRTTLATVGLSDEGKCVANIALLQEKNLNEDSAQWIAALWLTAYNGLMRSRERLESGDTSPDNLGMMIHDAEELGRFQERMFWRCGLENSTGKTRERMAISGGKQVKGGRDGNAMRGSNSFMARFGVEAQAMADDISARNPRLSWTAISKKVAVNYKVSRETVRKKLVNPKNNKKGG